MADLDQTIVFTVTKHNGTKIFFEPKSGRATGEILASRLPPESVIELRRGQSLVAEAKTVFSICGDKSYDCFFNGPAPLVRRSALAEQTITASHIHLNNERRLSFGINARTRGIRLGDEIHIKLSTLKDDSEQPPKQKGVAQWRDKLTEGNAEVAAKYQRARQREDLV